MHCFELRTTLIDYFVGQEGSEDTVPSPDSGIGAYIATSWETSIRQALMPVTANSSIYTKNLLIFY